VGKKIYCGNLSFKVSSADLEAMFLPFGVVRTAEIVMDRDTGQSKGFGFVEMDNEGDAQTAIQGLNETMHDGRALKVNEAKPREPRTGGGGGGGGRNFSRGGGGGGGGRRW
jgi:cold-inducible RNA-binding protein